MSNTNEKLSTILTEMCDERIIRIGDADATRCLLRNLAGRIKAAVKRECDEVEANALYAGGFVEATRHGSAAAMRKALNSIVGIAEDVFDGPERDREASQERALSTVISTARAALGAPARNCDRFQNFDEAIKTYAKENNVTVPWDMETYARMAMWLFAPVEHKKGNTKWNTLTAN